MLFIMLIIIFLCIIGGYLLYNKTMNKDNDLFNEQEDINKYHHAACIALRFYKLSGGACRI